MTPGAIDAVLQGSMQPQGACGDFTFTGTLLGGGPAIWNLDACPCGAQCLVPDPYTLTLTVPDAAMLPDTLMCPQIEIRRDPNTCELRSLVIRDLDNAERPEWIAGREAVAPAGVAELEVAAVNTTICLDFEQSALEFGWNDATVVVSQGDSDTLTADPDWTVYTVAAQTSEQAMTEDFAWVMTR